MPFMCCPLVFLCTFLSCNQSNLLCASRKAFRTPSPTHNTDRPKSPLDSPRACLSPPTGLQIITNLFWHLAFQTPQGSGYSGRTPGISRASLFSLGFERTNPLFTCKTPTPQDDPQTPKANLCALWRKTTSWNWPQGLRIWDGQRSFRNCLAS